MPRDEDVLELATRRRIYEAVAQQPGIYLRELQRAVGQPMGALEYHLGELRRAGLVQFETGDRKRIFAAGIDAATRHALSVLRQEALRRLILVLLRSGEMNHGNLSAETGFLPSTVSFYLAKLLKAGFILRDRQGREARYRLVDPERTLALLAAHRESFLDRILDRFLESFEGIRPRKPDADGPPAAREGTEP